MSLQDLRIKVGSMKKIIILGCLLIVGISAFAQEQYTYSPSYIGNLKICREYSEDYSTTIQTGDANSPELRVKSTEKVLGFINGKCYTKSTVYSYDLEKTILSIKCGLTREQLAFVVKKMNAVNAEPSKETKRALQDELTKIIENKSICRVKNYLEE